MTLTPAKRTTSSRPTLLVRLADWSYRRRRRVLLLWIVLLIATVFGRGRVRRRLRLHVHARRAPTRRRPRTSSRAASPRGPATTSTSSSRPARARPSTTRPCRRRSPTRSTSSRKQPHVSAVVSPFSPEGARQIAPRRTIAYGTLRLDQTVSDYKTATPRRCSRWARRSIVPTCGSSWRASRSAGAEQAQFSSEGIGLLVAALILLVSFGSLLAMGLPILIAVVGLGIGLSLVTLLANVLEVPDFAPQVAAMIGIGVGIDYVLFIVTRYRAALHDGLEPRAR